MGKSVVTLWYSRSDKGFAEVAVPAKKKAEEKKRALGAFGKSDYCRQLWSLSRLERGTSEEHYGRALVPGIHTRRQRSPSFALRTL